MTFPWETPAPAHSIEETVEALQRDFAYAVTHTAVLVHSERPALAMLVNTPRGQVIPTDVCSFTDGSTMQLQDLGMPQVGAPEMALPELLKHIWDAVNKLGLDPT